jgi:hypothetical protein
MMLGTEMADANKVISDRLFSFDCSLHGNNDRTDCRPSPCFERCNKARQSWGMRSGTVASSVSSQSA